MLTDDYRRTVALLLRIVPIVFASEAFALKGGTAINLYMSPVPRLSVDLDLVFLPLGLSRADALSEISLELAGIGKRAGQLGLSTRRVKKIAGDDSQLLVSDGETEVMMEVNLVIRGSVLPPRIMQLDPAAQELFATDVSARLLTPAEVYAGKSVAALDRQHPRDLFDIWIRNQSRVFASEDLNVFAVYLASHNRPPHEVLAGRDKPLESLYESSLIGMATGVMPTIRELEATRAHLRQQVLTHMPPEGRAFLLSFFDCKPDWTSLPFADLSRLPALQWKLENLEKFKKTRPKDFAQQNEALIKLLS